MQHPFWRLEQLLLPPPFSALSGLLLALGLAGLGVSAARHFRGARFEAIDGAAGAALAAGAFGALLHAAALLAWLPITPLRILAGLLAAFGLFFVSRNARWAFLAAAVLFRRWRSWPALDQVLAVLVMLGATGLFLAALGPPCDVDSVYYHLSVPLDWLRQGGAYPRPDWGYAKLVGIGEALNLLGIAGGTDSLGAMLQAEGVILAAIAVAAFAVRDRDRLVAIAMVVASPLLLSLVPSDKPQILPAAATAVALVMLVRRWNELDRSTLVLALGCAAFAMACKFTFLLSGSAIVAVGLIASRRTLPVFALVSAVAAVGLLAAPVYLRNLLFYGDPVSPFLERWRSSPDSSVVRFADELRECGGPRGLLGVPQLAIHALVGRPFTTALGIGILSPLLATWRNASVRRLLVTAAGVAALDVALGQMTPRFFLEPFLWSVAAMGVRERSIGVGWTALATAQASMAAVGAVIFATLFFPGAWSETWRERVLIAHGPGYAEARWLDEILRPDDVLLPSMGGIFFLPRSFVMDDHLDGSRSPAVEARELEWLKQDAGVSVLTVESGDDDLSPAVEAAALQGDPSAPARTFPERWRPSLEDVASWVRSIGGSSPAGVRKEFEAGGSPAVLRAIRLKPWGAERP